MKQLICEMCGSADLMKQDGVFVCQSCGCKYSVEEAKKMMVEGVVEVQGKVQVDTSHMIGNYLEMAQAAQDAGNNVEAEAYCNKIIEIEPTNYKAWMLKGQAAAWQSTLQNSRVDEGVAAFIKAINNAPEEDREELVETAKEQIKSLSLAMISLRADRFAKWPDKEETNGFIADITDIFTMVTNFLVQTSEIVPISELMEPIATKINQSVVKAWQDVVWPDYDGDSNDSDDRANKYEWQTFIERVGNCTTLVEQAINLCDEDSEADITRYENLIFFHEKAIDSCSWDYDFTEYGKKWRKEWSLTEDAKRVRRNLIAQYKTKIAEIKTDIENKKKESVKEGYKDCSIDELLALSYEQICSKNSVEATAFYELIIDKIPNERVGYVGKSIALICEDSDSVLLTTLFAPILVAKDKAGSPEYDVYTRKLLDHQCGETGLTLLMYACDSKNVEVVQALIDMGADINKHSKNNTTALWHVCYKALSEDKAASGRQIAKILLDMGAEADVVNKGGVALFNSTTDAMIANMITSKYPALQKGSAPASSKSNGGCYVATAVYGSYDCPQVWTLRRYRDYTLAETWYGRAFIRTYYAVSPTLVKWFGDTNWFKKMWKDKLDHMVADLQEKGFESTPYEDRSW